MAAIFNKSYYGLITVKMPGKANMIYCYNDYETRKQIVEVIERKQGVTYYTIQPAETRVNNVVAQRETKKLLDNHLLKIA